MLHTESRQRLIRYTVSIDLLEKNVLNTYFSMAFGNSELFNTSDEMPYIRFSVKVSYYKRATKFKEFGRTTKAFCKRLGYVSPQVGVVWVMIHSVNTSTVYSQLENVMLKLSNILHIWGQTKHIMTN